MILLPFEALVATLLLIAFVFVQPVHGQEGGTSSTTVSNSDPDITYTPSYCNSSEPTACLGSWWNTTLSDGTEVKTSAGPSSTFYNAPTWLQFSFYGTKVDIHGLSDVQGSMLIVQLDGSMVLLNTSTGFDGASMASKKLASLSSLDNDMVHSLSIGWCANENTNASSGLPYAQSFAYFSHLSIDNFREASVVSSSASSSSSSSSSGDVSSSGSDGLSNGQKVAVALGALAGGITLFIAIIVISRRSRYARLFPNLSRRLRRASGDVEVVISSESLRRADSIFDYDFKARPHTSLPPSYVNTSDGAGSRSSGSSNNGYLKSSKAFDLELGAIDDDPFKSDYSTPGHARSDGLPTSPRRSESQLRVLKAARKVGSKLRVVTSESVLGTGRVSRAPQTAELSAFPMTPFVVGTASIAQTQTPSIVSAVSTSASQLPTATTKPRTFPSVMSTVPSIPSSKPAPTSSEKKARRSKSINISSRLPGSDRSTPTSMPAQSDASSSSSRKHSKAPPSLPQAPLPVHAHTSTHLEERPSLSFDTFSITSRSVPPPYALYPM